MKKIRLMDLIQILSILILISGCAGVSARIDSVYNTIGDVMHDTEYSLYEADSIVINKFDPQKYKRVAIIYDTENNHGDASSINDDSSLVVDFGIAFQSFGYEVVEREKVRKLINEADINIDGRTFSSAEDREKSLGELLRADLLVYVDIIANNAAFVYRLSMRGSILGNPEEMYEAEQRANKLGFVQNPDNKNYDITGYYDVGYTARAVDTSTGKIIWVGYRLAIKATNISDNDMDSYDEFSTMSEVCRSLVKDFSEGVHKHDDYEYDPAIADSKDVVTLQLNTTREDIDMLGNSVAIVDFAGECGQAMTDILTIEFVRAGYNVVERENISRIIQESDIAGAKNEDESYITLTTDERMKYFGNMFQADVIVTGQLDRLIPPEFYIKSKKACYDTGSIRLSARAFDANTGKILWTARINSIVCAKTGDQLDIMDFLVEPCKELVTSFTDVIPRNINKTFVGTEVDSNRKERQRIIKVNQNLNLR